MGLIDRVSIKREAKTLVRTGRRSVILMGTLYSVLYAVVSAFNSLTLHLEPGSLLTFFIPVMIFFITSVLSAGLVLFCQTIRRGEEAPYSMLFDGFSMAPRIILLNILMYVRVMLWSMLFVIPGIIALYRYRFAIYNLMENPALTANQAIALSKVQTNGMKWQLFMLDVSFVGWMILDVLTLGILSIYIVPYMQLSDLGFYEVGKQVLSPFPPKAEGPQSTF